MKSLMTKYAATLSLILCLPGARRGRPDEQMQGRHPEGAVRFHRQRIHARHSGPGIPWVPKAIIEVLQFNGDGTLTTPALTAANPFGGEPKITMIRVRNLTKRIS